MADLTPGFNLAHWGPIPYPAASGTKNLLGFGGGSSSADAVNQTPNTDTVNVSDKLGYLPIVDSSGNPTSNQDVAAYQAQLGDLKSLLGRTQTGLDQGLQGLNGSYTSNLNQDKNQENQALQDYTDQRVATNKDKLGAYDAINSNANNGYRSLAQIIGRAAGAGSSAFQELLPDVVGKDISAKRTDANTTYASNLGNIDTAQKKTENSFQNILADLANQRNQQEQTLRTGVENQRQTLLQNEQQTAANLATAQGGNPVTAAAQYQPQIESSRNAVENFFNQFKPSITPQQAVVAAPDLTKYTVDRSNVNAASTPDPTDDSNPYAAILRKQLQDQGAF